MTRPAVESFVHSLKVESVHGMPLMKPVAIPPLDTSALRHSKPG